MGITKVNFSEVFNNKIKILFQNESIKITEQDLAIPNQTHSSNVQFVTKPGTYDDTDGLVTSKDYNLKLSTKVADCVPIYLYDSKNNFYGFYKRRPMVEATSAILQENAHSLSYHARTLTVRSPTTFV